MKPAGLLLWAASALLLAGCVPADHEVGLCSYMCKGCCGGCDDDDEDCKAAAAAASGSSSQPDSMMHDSSAMPADTQQ